MRASLFDSIPVDIRERSDTFDVGSAEWHADDKGMFRCMRNFPAETPLALACSWLEQLRSFWYSSRLRLNDGRTLYFKNEGFSHLEETEDVKQDDRYILYDTEQQDPKKNSELFLASNRFDRPFPGTRWLPSGSVLLGPRLNIQHSSCENRLDALVALGIRQYLSLRLENKAPVNSQQKAVAVRLEKKTQEYGYSIESHIWKAAEKGGGLDNPGTLGEWLISQTPSVGFIYVEGEADLIEAAERSWMKACGRKDPYEQQEGLALFSRQREPGVCIQKGGTL